MRRSPGIRSAAARAGTASPSVVMSNCGFALAPCKPADREWFARCLSAVEDIPTEAMAAGIDWTWETFPEYLADRRAPAQGDQLRHVYRPFGAAHVRHGQARAVREGDRGRHDAHGRGRAGGAEGRRAGLLELARLDARHAGRHAGRQPHRRMGGDRPHRRRDGRARCRHLPGRAGHRQRRARIAPSSSGCARWRSQTRRPIMFGVLATKQGDDPNPWDYQTEYIDDTVAAGGRMFGQGTTRSINAIFSLKSYLPFDVLPALAGDPRACRWTSRRAAADPEVRRAAGRGRGGDEAARQRRSRAAARRPPIRASPTTPTCSPMKGVDWDDPTVERARPGARPASGRGDDRPVAGQRQPGLSSSRWSTNRRTTCWASCSIRARWRPSRIPARMSARRWARRCRRIC